MKRTYVPTPGGVRCIETGHEYPSEFTPERVADVWSATQAWQILDIVKAGVISGDVRALLAGMISAALEKAFERGRKERPN